MKHWLCQVPFAHRGLHCNRDRPENSMAAFRAAMDGGYGIELDVQQLADGEVVVFHDERLERATGEAGYLSNVTKKQIEGAVLFGTGERIPLLAQVLELVAGKVPLLIEVKRYATTPSFEHALAGLLTGYCGQFAVQSFDVRSVSWFRHRQPSFCRGLVCEKLHEIPQGTLIRCRPNFIACSHSERPLKKAGMPILTWTVRSESERAALGGFVDNIIFEKFVPG